MYYVEGKEPLRGINMTKTTAAREIYDVDYSSGPGPGDSAVDYMMVSVPDRSGELIEVYAEAAPLEDDEIGTYNALIEAILDRAADLNVDMSRVRFWYDEDCTYTCMDAEDDMIPVATAVSPHVITRMAEAYMARTGRPVYVSWRRASDGTQAYLDQDGNHAPTGTFWGVE